MLTLKNHEMKLSIQLLILFLSLNYVSAQSMLDLNTPSAVKKAHIYQCIEVLDGKDSWTMYYDTNGYQIKNSFYAPKIDSNGNLIEGFYGIALFKNDHLGNKIEKKIFDPTLDSIPYSRTLYTYNERNQLILEERRDKDNVKETTEDYLYSDSLLVKKIFSSSQETDTVLYSYDHSNRLSSFSLKKDNELPVFTEVYYTKDTTFHKRLDSSGNIIYQYYKIENEKNIVTEIFVWDKTNHHQYKITWFYNELNLLEKIERYNYISNQTRYTYFKYE